jgi:aminodeoxyfutalosine deaminase
MCGDPVENGELIIDGGNIVEVSTTQSDGDALDLSDCLLMPGFVNAHCHLGLAALEKKLSPAENFVDWIRELISLNSDLDNESRIKGVFAGAEAMKRSGVTTLGDYVADPELLSVIDKLGFRSVLFLETIGFHSDQAKVLSQKVEDVLKSESLSPLAQLGLAPHAPYSASPVLFRNLAKLAEQYQCPISCHVAEIKEESRFLVLGDDSLEELLKERSSWDADWHPPYMSPMQYLSSLGFLDRLIAVHCNFVSGDIKIMKSKKVNAVFCPNSTQWFNRTEIMPVRDLLDQGIPVALGTDSLASNDSLNFLSELRTADKLLPEVSRKEILTMATQYGGEALGLECGKLASGQKADLIGFRVSSSVSWFDVPFEVNRHEVDFYMVDGKPSTRFTVSS